MSIVKRVIKRGRRELKKASRLRRLEELGLKYVHPNFLYHADLKKDGVAVDAGCSYEADFSQYMINEHHLKAYGVDPTRKHQPALKALEERYVDRFTHLPLAISAQNGTLTFHESAENESGSLLDDHVNVRQDQITSYKVESVTLRALSERVGDEVEILKLDLEGAEYALLDEVSADDLTPFKQVFIEFHHHAIPEYNVSDTARLVKRIEGFGYQSYSLDDHNYIFYR